LLVVLCELNVKFTENVRKKDVVAKSDVIPQYLRGKTGSDNKIHSYVI